MFCCMTRPGHACHQKVAAASKRKCIARSKALMSRNILVMANCQTGGLVAALTFMLPKDNITGLHWGRGADTIRKMVDAVGSCDVLVTSAPIDVLKMLVEEHKCDLKNPVIIPSILFRGFHPDTAVSYVAAGPVNVVDGSPFMSSIGVWCWRNSMSVSQAMGLFNEATYRAVRYHDMWSLEIERLRHEFVELGFSFSDFFLPIQSFVSPFMYVANHPNIAVITQLARGIAIRLGGDPAVVQQPFERILPDALRDSDIWPVYSGLSGYLGMEPDFIWRIGGVHYDLGGFLKLQFDALNRQQEAIHCPEVDTPLFDQRMRLVVS